VMNSRRLICTPKVARDHNAHYEIGLCPLWVRSGHMQRTNPCPLYPNSDRESGHLPRGHVCFTPESGHVRCNGSCRLWAKSGLSEQKVRP